MGAYHRLLGTTLIPWRLRNMTEQWVEGGCRERYSGLYRKLHLGHGEGEPQPLTAGPSHHFFGYYDKSLWNESGRYVLSHRVGFNDHVPQEDDVVEIGLIDREAGKSFSPFSRSSAWNWQQGAMLQWDPLSPETRFTFNDRRNGRFVGIVHDVDAGECEVSGRPIYALLPGSPVAFSLNFARLAVHRPGYGYAGGLDPFADARHPAGDGIWRVERDSDAAELIVSLDQLANTNPKPSMAEAWHYVNHIQCSRGGKRIAFFHIWHGEGKGWEVRLYTCQPDGDDLRCMLDTGFISHYDWRDDDTIIVWANTGDAPSAQARFLLLSHRNEGIQFFADETVKEDGHCTFSPDGRWVLNDTYPDRHQMRNLMLLEASTGRRVEIARLHSPKSRWWGELRCDLHPRWRRDGRAVCIDSVHEGSRQMYEIDVSRWVA